ncbi:MAG: hypothetical protein JW741_13370 [Sedimentisphaerales bacterium]|nr:hypothetical protein [Sedimentisphaerales bacterium]
MKTESKGIRLRAFRLFMAFILTPLVLMIWVGMSLEAVMPHFGAHPDGPAKVVLGLFVMVVGFGVPFSCLLCLGLPYVFVMLGKGRLNLLTVGLPTLLLAIAYGLGIYRSLLYYRHPAFARSIALLSVPGVIVSGLFFYFVGVWKIVQEKPESPGDSIARRE